jgi:hypothetical protein
MAGFNEQIQKFTNRYMQERGSFTFTTKEIAVWMIAKKLWQPQHSALIKQCSEEIARALREEYITDLQGRRVRAKHVVISTQDGEQIPLWSDIRTATRDHMAAAFQQRRHRIVGDCRQLKTDVDSYNENSNGGEPVQIPFDFTADLEELEITL